MVVIESTCDDHGRSAFGPCGTDTIDRHHIARVRHAHCPLSAERYAASSFVQYRAPAFADELLEVQNCIAHVHGARMLWQQELFRTSTGALLALAEVNGALTTADGRPGRIPAPPMRQRLEAISLPDAAWGPTQPPRRFLRGSS